MGVISDVLSKTDEKMVAYVQNVYDAVSTPLNYTLGLAGGLSLIFVAINHIYNVRSVTYSVYILWAVRYACIIAFSTGLNYGVPHYLNDLIKELPASYGAATIASVTTSREERYKCGEHRGPFDKVNWKNKYCTRTIVETTPLVKDANGVNELLDKFIRSIFDKGQSLYNRVGWDAGTWKFMLSGFIVYLIGFFFTATAILILLMSNIGLALMFGLAPLAVAMLTFPQTRAYFHNWLSMTVGFALVPMLIMALMSIVLTVAYEIPPGDDDFFGGNLSFLLVALSAIAFLFQVPSMASTLASSSLPQMGAGQMAGAASRLAQVARAPFTAARTAISAPLAARAAINDRMGAGKSAAEAASAGGKGRLGTAYAGTKAMMQSSQYRAQKANRTNIRDSVLERAKTKNTTNTQPAPKATSNNNTPVASASNQYLQNQRLRGTGNNDPI